MYGRLIELVEAAVDHASHADMGALDLVAMEINDTVAHVRVSANIDERALVMVKQVSDLITKIGPQSFPESEAYFNRIAICGRASRLMLRKSEPAEHPFAAVAAEGC